MRPGLLFALAALSCTPVSPTSPAAPPAASPPPATATEPEAPAPTPAADNVWRFTTLVTNGPAGMLGKHAHYELTFDLAHSIPTATLRRVAVEGKPLADDAIMVASTTPNRTPTFDDETETEMTMRFDLRGAKGRQPLVVHAWIASDRIIGRWYHDHGKGIEGDGDGNSITGVLVGRRGAQELVALESASELPCPICCDAIANCGGMGSQSCNASNVCLAACSPSDHGSLDPLPKGQRMIDLRTGCSADSP